MKNFIQAILLIIVLASCGDKAEVPPPPQAFCLSDTMQKKITVSEVVSQSVRNEITLSGKIEANEDKWVKVFPVVDGIVQTLNVQLGDYVQKGKTLAVVRSSNIAEYQNQVANTGYAVSTAEKNLQSTEELFAAGLATQRDVVSAKNELQKAQSDARKALQVSQIYGARSNAVQSIAAPISGFVVEKNVTDQMQYQASGLDPFFIISNLDEVWVMANVFESDIARVKVGYDADINVMAFPNKTYTGKVDRIFNVLDPQSRVMKVRMRIPNPDFSLKPEMFARVNIRYNEAGSTMPAIPSNAVIFDNNKNFVLVIKDNCHIESREVDVFKTSGATTYIKSGLQQGEKIISKNQLLIYDALTD